MRTVGRHFSHPEHTLKVESGPAFTFIFWPYSHDIIQVALPSALSSHWDKVSGPVNYRTKPREMQVNKNSNLYQSFVSCEPLHRKLSKKTSSIFYFLLSWNHAWYICSCHAIDYPLSRPWPWTMAKALLRPVMNSLFLIYLMWYWCLI